MKLYHGTVVSVCKDIAQVALELDDERLLRELRRKDIDPAGLKPEEFRELHKAGPKVGTECYLLLNGNYQVKKGFF